MTVLQAIGRQINVCFVDSLKFGLKLWIKDELSPRDKLTDCPVQGLDEPLLSRVILLCVLVISYLVERDCHQALA